MCVCVCIYMYVYIHAHLITAMASLETSEHHCRLDACRHDACKHDGCKHDGCKHNVLSMMHLARLDCWGPQFCCVAQKSRRITQGTLQALWLRGEIEATLRSRATCTGKHFDLVTNGTGICYRKSAVYFSQVTVDLGEIGLVSSMCRGTARQRDTVLRLCKTHTHTHIHIHTHAYTHTLICISWGTARQ